MDPSTELSTATAPSAEPSTSLQATRDEEASAASSVISKKDELSATPDWSEEATNEEHLWNPISSSGNICYVGESECTKRGPRLRCSACKIVVHRSCIPTLKFYCKPTFRDVDVFGDKERIPVFHHWVYKRSQTGKCETCGKSLQSKLSFRKKGIVAVLCSWCQTAYHDREVCFDIQKINEECDLGYHKQVIIPPSWIVKLPRQTDTLCPTEDRAFTVEPILSGPEKPVIVFINPKSGGKQGLKLMRIFQELLNPRQVFDLSKGGPKFGLEMYRTVEGLRILVCGGDGTVGWVLSVLSEIAFPTLPPVGVLPLGTGNDLARALGWGPGYTDEPISAVLNKVAESDTVLLDRWTLSVEPNLVPESVDGGQDKPPLTTVNNYFSLGVDAQIALEFHEAREAHPKIFTSRFRNKLFYGWEGSQKLLKREWRTLSEFVQLECDGKDFTPALKEHKVHAILFLNIPFYGGGTRPWNVIPGTKEPTCDDGHIEVIGLTVYQLPLLQAGGHGTAITQCKQAKIITNKVIPVQVDGEACLHSPCIIEVSLRDTVPMLKVVETGSR